MYHQLVEMLHQMAVQDVKTFPNYRAVIMLRNTIHEKGNVDFSTANKIAMGADIQLPELSDEEIQALIEPLATVADNMVNAFLSEGFAQEEITTGLAGQLSLTLNA